ncbi:hypothetical protein, partial [Campylobacter lanienae]|uniref:hypothetical protein n=1 Tax=Campylobacter lanienae TaxID=75658 RepID=UPI00112F737A
MNNSKILLSSITISILCSVNLSAACNTYGGTENGDTCTISGGTITSSVTPWHNGQGDSIGKTLI